MGPGRLTVLGNAAIDIAYQLDALPRPGETIIALDVSNDLGGKGLNQAIAAARAGARPRLVAPVGDDDVARSIASLLASEGVGNGMVLRKGRSDSAIILIDRHGENLIISDTGQVEALLFEEALPQLPLGPADLLLLQGNLSQATTGMALAHARAAGASIALNPSPLRPWLIDAAVDLLIANRLEAALWTGLLQDSAAEALIGAIQTPMAIVTLGAEGALLRIGNAIHAVPAPKVKPVDTTGAGDVLAGVFCALLIADVEPVRALSIAVQAASQQTLNHGTIRAMPSRATIQSFIDASS
jgi:ribokinase